jgi:hypothetical protein
VKRTDDGDHLETPVEVELAFYKGGGYKFAALVINSLQIAATAGEVVNFTVDFAGWSPPTRLESSTAMACSKLVTWDRVVFGFGSGSGSGDLVSDSYQSITFTLNNNVQKAYAISGVPGNLYPADLPCGVREITGTVAAYAKGSPGGGADTWCDYEASSAASMVFKIVGCDGDIMNIAFKGVFSRPEGAGTTGLAIYSANFTGVCDLTSSGSGSA